MNWRRSWPEACALAVFAAGVWWMGARVAEAAGGVALTIDDSYTHLATARTLIESGTYGITAGQPVGASSSPVWVLLLAAAFMVAGPTVAVPIGLNVLAGAGVVWTIGTWWRNAGWSDVTRALGLSLTVAAVPLPSLVWLGMEHSAQVLVAVALLGHGALVCSVPVGAPAGRRGVTVLMVLAAIGCGLRYETVALVVALCVGLLIRRRFCVAVGVVAAAVSVPITHAAWASTHGLPWLPMAIEQRRSYLVTLNQSALAEPGAVVVLVLGVLMAVWLVRSIRTGSTWTTEQWLPLLVLIGAVVHVAGVHESGPFGRYDAVLVCLCVGAAGVIAPRVTRVGVGVLLVGLAALVTTRGWHVAQLSPTAAGEVAQQQGQLARLCRDIMRGPVIAVNDIGMVAWAGCPLVDLAGLATPAVQVFQSQSNQDVVETMRTAVRGADVALIAIYDEWFAARPDEWVRVGQWTIAPWQYQASATVAVYAPDVTRVNQAVRWFEAFAKGLPDDVTSVTFVTRIADAQSP